MIDGCIHFCFALCLATSSRSICRQFFDVVLRTGHLPILRETSILHALNSPERGGCYRALNMESGMADGPASRNMNRLLRSCEVRRLRSPSGMGDTFERSRDWICDFGIVT